MSAKVGAKTKGWIKNNVSGEIRNFQFNPTNLSHSRGASYAEISAPGMSYPNTQYVQGQSRVFPVELFMYDGTGTRQIESFESYLMTFLPPETNVGGFVKPPDMTFCYGYFIRKCVLENLDVMIEELDNKGGPIVARFTLQLRQVGM